LHVYFGSRIQDSELYEDAGDGYGYTSKESNVCKFIITGNINHFKIIQAFTSNYSPSYHFYKIIIHGLPFLPDEYFLDGKPHKLSKRNFALGTVKFRVRRGFEEITLSAG
jgi:alpha-glucosidase